LGVKAWWRSAENPTRHPARGWTGEDRHLRSAAVVDEAELARLARLVARLSPAQQRLMVALADGFRGGWLEPVQWERAWRGSDLDDDGVLSDARTWLARRPRHPL
jgi:hypothetical protein